MGVGVAILVLKVRWAWRVAEPGGRIAGRKRRKQRDPNPKDYSLTRKETLAAALFTYQGVVVGVRVHLFAAQDGNDAPATCVVAALLSL